LTCADSGDGTNGYVVVTVPVGSDTLDVTPLVTTTADSYTFNVSVYQSYFEIFDEQASPGGVLFWGTNNVGHAWWRLSTEVPANALQYISTNLTVYLNHSWGFYPTNDGTKALFSLHGLVANDDSTTPDIQRKFYINFSDLLNGLEFTKGIKNNPPVYTLLVYDCVDAAVEAASKANVKLGNQIFGVNGYNGAPQYFALYLAQWYPGPWLNNTNIFSP
jgi:hypothetical protein